MCDENLKAIWPEFLKKKMARKPKNLNLIQDGGQTDTLKNKTKKPFSISGTGNTWLKFQDCSFKGLDIIALTKISWNNKKKNNKKQNDYNRCAELKLLHP